VTDVVAPPEPKRKKPASMSPTKRARAQMLKFGWTSQIVERWNPFAHVRQDLFGVIDILAIGPSIGVLGVQATGGDGGNHAAREQKITAEPRALVWLLSGGSLEVWSFAKRSGGVRGGRKFWTMRRSRAVVREGRIEWTEIGPGAAAPEGAAS
jgi:hypothetical protein